MHAYASHTNAQSQFSDDLAYWRKNSYPITFQNHAAGFVLSGSNIRINGHGTGGIHGNGDAWYNAEEAHTKPGRPMPFVFWHVKEVTVKNFYVVQPQLWAINIMNGTNMLFDNIYVNATASRAPWGKNWVQNTDGFDTMDARNVKLFNLIYQGGDDCIAIKPRSYNIEVRNVTCRGGNGIAIGSLGQYLEDSSVEDVIVSNVKVPPTDPTITHPPTP
jgi:polygalacturonase